MKQTRLFVPALTTPTLLLVACSVPGLTGNRQVFGQEPPQKSPPAIEIPTPKPGEADYDKAIQLRIKIDSVEKLNQVISLTESAIEKGLSPESELSAKQFLGSAYTDKAKLNLQSVLQGGGPRSRLSKVMQESFDYVSKAIDLDPLQTDAYVLKAQILSDRQDIEEALEVISNGIKFFEAKFAERKSSEVRSSLSKLYDVRASLLDDPVQQLAEIEKAHEVNPLDEALTKKYLALLGQMEQFDKLIKTIDELLESSSDNIELVAAKISALLRQNKVEEAIAFSTKRIDMATEDEVKATLLRQRALLYQSLAAELMTNAKEAETAPDKEAPEVTKNLELAKSDLDQSLKLVKDNIQAIFLRARLSAQMDDAKSAREDINLVLEADENNLDARLFSAELAMVEKEYKRAIDDYKAIVARFGDGTPQREEFLRKLAIAYWQDQQIKQALRTLDQILRSNSSSWETHRLRGEIFLGQGEHTDAVMAYDKALRLMPENADSAAQSNLLNNFAWILATSTDDRVRDGERALELGLKACEITDFSEAHLVSTLAAAYAENGNFEKAVEYSRKAVELGEKEDTPQIEQLREELKSYEAKKPWREKQTPGSKPE